jgi:integrase
MASILKRTTSSGDNRWDVKYRDDGNRQRMRTFKRRIDAQRFANTVEADVLRGDWIDPDKGKELFSEWATRWLATLGDRKPKTRAGYESIVARHLLPRYADTPIAAIDYPEALAFIGELRASGLGQGTVRNIRDVLRLVLQLAVRSGSLKTNPVSDIESPKRRRQAMVFLDPDQIVTLAAEVTKPPPRYRRGERRRDGYPEYGLLVRFAAFTGLRAGELAALRASNIDLMRRRVDVHESVSEAHGELQLVPTKTYERRSVPIPASFVDELAGHLREHEPSDFVWSSPQWGLFRHSNWYPRHYKPAVARAGLPAGTRFHDLRHSYAAMLIAKGAHPRAIMERLGHSTITVTLDTYGHLFPSLEEHLDDALDRLYVDAKPTPPATVRRLTAES